MTGMDLRLKLAALVRSSRFLPHYAAARLLLRSLPLDRLAGLAWRNPKRPRRPELEARLIGDILRVSRHLGPVDHDCLPRSLILFRVLSAAGADPQLVCGFRRESGQLSGHAWVVIDGRAVAETPAEDLVPTVVFGRDGRRLDGLKTT
jgi:hypothetical protein